MTPRCVIEDNIEMDLKGVGYEIVDGIDLVQGIYHFRALLKTAMELRYNPYPANVEDMGSS